MNDQKCTGGYYMISKVALFMTVPISMHPSQFNFFQLPKMQKNLRDSGIECPGDIGPVWRQVKYFMNTCLNKYFMNICLKYWHQVTPSHRCPLNISKIPAWQIVFKYSIYEDIFQINLMKLKLVHIWI